MIQTIQAGVPVARIEVADAMQMDAINKYSKLDPPVAPTLWLEFHGTEAGVAEQGEMVQKITVDPTFWKVSELLRTKPKSEGTSARLKQGRENSV